MSLFSPLEFLLEAERIADNDFQPHIQVMAIEFNDLVGKHGGCRMAICCMRKSLESFGAGSMGSGTKGSQHFSCHVGGKGSHAHTIGVQGIVGCGDPGGRALHDESGVQVAQSAKSGFENAVGADLIKHDRVL
jgi:hypothetical protein